MPQFSLNEEKVALATFPVMPAGLECTAKLWLASDTVEVAASGEIPFVATGVDQSIALPITMPGIEGVYPVNLGVFSGGVLIKSFRADEDVVIAPVEVYTCVYEGIQFSTEDDLIHHMNTNHPGMPYIVYAHLISDTVYQGELFTVSLKVFVPTIPADRHYYFLLNYNARYTKPESIWDWCVMSARTPEGFYLKEITLGTRHVAGYAEPKTHIIYSLGFYYIFDGPLVTFWDAIDIGLRITVLSAKG